MHRVKRMPTFCYGHSDVNQTCPIGNELTHTAACWHYTYHWPQIRYASNLSVAAYSTNWVYWCRNSLAQWTCTALLFTQRQSATLSSGMPAAWPLLLTQIKVYQLSSRSQTSHWLELYFCLLLVACRPSIWFPVSSSYVAFICPQSIFAPIPSHWGFNLWILPGWLTDWLTDANPNPKSKQAKWNLRSFSSNPSFWISTMQSRKSGLPFSSTVYLPYQAQLIVSLAKNQ
jgi:hypothetical protein